MVKARTDQGFQQCWANLSAAQRALRVKKQSDDKRKYDASLDPAERAAIAKNGSLQIARKTTRREHPEEVYRRNQGHLWTVGWCFASKYWDMMLRINVLGREGKYQVLTLVALEDVCDSSWKGGRNPARMSMV